LFSFDAPPGQTLAREDLPVGRFTKAVAKYIGESGLSLTEVFASVKGQVGRENPDAPIPYEVDNVTIQDFYFHAPVKPVEVIPPVSTTRKKGEPSPGLPVQNKKDRLEYVWIPGGTFKMGCVPGSQCEQNETPQHKVTLSKGFFMGRTEVEVEAYQRYTSAQGIKMPRGNLDDPRWKVTNNPMSNVSWEDAKSYCSWAGGRLPSEAEWEYAARGGLEDQAFPLNDENSRDKANFAGKKGNDIYDGVATVRKFDPNSFGLFDMAGNVWEWVNDLYSPNYYRQSPAVDPPGPDDGKEHVARGGSFDSNPKLHLRISFRKSYGKPGNLVGFRCVMDDTSDTRKLLNMPLKDN
jgi:formylglycine-generating enzyme required for sulfatase activity